jgi:filamentous hemagglutinin
VTVRVPERPPTANAPPPVSNQNIQSRANGFPNQRIPASEGRWTGEVGNSGWVSSKPEVRAITKGEPVPFKEGFPDFSQWKVGEVKLAKISGNHKSDFNIADKLYAQQRGWFKPNGEPDLARVRQLRRSEGLTWHHHQDLTTMELVPRALNNNICHTGGAALAKR